MIEGARRKRKPLRPGSCQIDMIVQTLLHIWPFLLLLICFCFSFVFFEEIQKMQQHPRKPAFVKMREGTPKEVKNKKNKK